MAEVETSVEYAGDISGQVLKTTTIESFGSIDAPSGSQLRSWKLGYTDGKQTLTKEEFDTFPEVVYSGDGSTSSEAIETHPSLQGLSATDRNNWLLWKQNPNDPTLNGWNPKDDTNPLIQKLYGWYSTGITTYLAPRVTIKHTTLEDQPPSLSLVGTIADPGGGFDFEGNFIVTGVSFQQEGQKWRVTVEYLGSQRGQNWDPTIYT